MANIKDLSIEPGSGILTPHRTYQDVEKDYLELIYAVGKKWPNETRHQTALRYILEAEREDTTPAKQDVQINNTPAISANGNVYWNVRDILFGPNRGK